MHFSLPNDTATKLADPLTSTLDHPGVENVVTRGTLQPLTK
jgi:hypothetical protein